MFNRELRGVRNITDQLSDLNSAWKKAIWLQIKLKQLEYDIHDGFSVCTKKYAVLGLTSVAERSKKNFIQLTQETVPNVLEHLRFFKSNILMNFLTKKISSTVTRIQEKLRLLIYHAELSSLEYDMKQNFSTSEVFVNRYIDLQIRSRGLVTSQQVQTSYDMLRLDYRVLNVARKLHFPTSYVAIEQSNLN
jgi:hypothetical protein